MRKAVSDDQENIVEVQLEFLVREFNFFMGMPVLEERTSKYRGFGWYSVGRDKRFFSALNWDPAVQGTAITVEVERITLIVSTMVTKEAAPKPNPAG